VNGLPQELIFLLLVGLFWLAQFVLQQRRRQAPPDPQPAREEGAAVLAEEAAEPAPRPRAPQPSLAEGPRPAPPPRDRNALAPAAPLRPAARRYARGALMGNRRAVQNAVVTAAILQPCRAQRPYGME